MSLNYLELRDIENLVNLLLRSQQSKAREALCIRIGVEFYRLSFIRDSSDSDFLIQLIEYLDRIGNKESLCKLCCEELLPIFGKSEIYAPILREIAAKLDCVQEFIHNSKCVRNDRALGGAVVATSRACKYWRYQLPNRGDRITPACHITHPPMANTTHYYQLVEHVSTFQ